MKPVDPVKVIIPEVSGDVWMGGKLYFENLVNTVSGQYPEITFTNYLPGYKPSVPVDFMSRVVRKVKGAGYFQELDSAGEKYFRELAEGHRAVIFSNHVVNHRGTVPFIFWIPDFQFLHLAGHAEKNYIESAKKMAKSGAEKASLVMLSSEDALRDFSEFLPEFAHKGRVVSFVKQIDARYLSTDCAGVAAKYHLPSAFFYVPNQFWKHKNHMMVLQALVELKKSSVKPFVVFSGNVHDFRNPTYFNELLSYVSLNGIRDQVAFLGMIPYGDVVSLIRQSVAVINPSLFEGWSTTVEEVKSIGKKMILSDLNVHKEQSPEHAIFFERENPLSLAEKMKLSWSNAGGPDAAMEAESMKHAAARQKVFGDKFRTLIDESIMIESRGKAQ